MAGSLVLVGAAALALRADSRGGDNWEMLRVATTPATLGMLLFAVARRLRRPVTRDESTLLWIGACASVLAYTLLILKSSSHLDIDEFWARIASFTMVDPACLGVLLFLSAGPTNDGRLLGAPSKFGRGVAASAIAGSVAFAIKSVTESHFDGNIFWTFLALTTAPCAAGFLLFGASRSEVPGATPLLEAVAFLGGSAMAVAALAYGVKLASDAPMLGFWVFLTTAVVPFGLGLLAAVGSRENVRGPQLQLAGLGVVAAALALSIRLISADPIEAFLLQWITVGTRLFGWEYLSIVTASDQDFWLFLAYGITPAAIGVLVFAAAQPARPSWPPAPWEEDLLPSPAGDRDGAPNGGAFFSRSRP